MDITITGQQVELTPPLRDYAHEKISKLARHVENIIKAHVVLKVENERKELHVAHADVHVGGADFYAKAEAGDMYSAIDLLADKLGQQLRKFKEKH
jgi:putative sigma-54 modulation protein